MSNCNHHHIRLYDLEVYRLAREISRLAWTIYQKLHWQDRKTMGNQFLTASDSIGANLTEGYYRFHFLDKIKFFYNSRGSLGEARDYWIELLAERGKIKVEEYYDYVEFCNKYGKKLNRFIQTTYEASKNPTK